MLLVTELGDVGVAVRLERGGTSGDDERGDEEQAERGGVGGRHRDDGADHEQGEAGDDASLVAILLGNRAGRNGHDEVSAVVGDLHERGLGRRQLEVVRDRGVQRADQVHGQAPDEEQ